MSINKLTIFWIEDNPIIGNEDDGTVDEVNGLKFPKLLHKDCFTYYLFQHPKQVEEYLSMINKLTSNDGTTTVADKCPGGLPDIVVFDYKMFDAFSRNINALQYSNQEHFNFLQATSVSHQIKKCFPKLFETQPLFLERNDVRNGEYMGDKFKDELKAAVIESDDEFGLFCGIAIIREFKDYITFGVPATINKADKSRMSYNSLFYEWINSYDLKGTIERPVQDATSESKDWENILTFAIDKLRKRIIAQMQSGKITINYAQILEYTEKIPSDKNEQTLTFQSYYGERTLPLDGLFFDTPEDTRDEKIKIWAGELLEKMPMGNDVIKKSIDLSTQLWNAYLNNFEDRMILSDYIYRIASLNADEKKYLIEVKKSLGIDSSTGLIAEENECSIKSLLNGEKDIYVKRLTALISVTNATIELEKQRVESDMNEKYPPLTSWEYFNILFPKINLKGNVILPMHCDTKTNKDVITDTERKWLFRNLTTKQNEVTLGNTFHFSEWISKGEKEVLKSIFYNESKYYPEWLK